MKRIYLILTALSLSLSGLNAATLTPGEALSRLSSAKGPKKVSGRLDRMDVVHTLRTLNGNPSAYIFADRNAGGYLVVSADDCAAPLLGYSESGSFDSESLPPQFESTPDRLSMPRWQSCRRMTPLLCRVWMVARL